MKKIVLIFLSAAALGLFCAYNIRLGSAEVPATAMPAGPQETLFGYVKSIAQCDKNCDFKVEEVRCRVRQLIKQGEDPQAQVTFESMLVGGHELGRNLKKKTGSIHEYVQGLEETTAWWCNLEGSKKANAWFWWKPEDKKFIPVAKKLQKVFQAISEETKPSA